jgi:uroporphyrinogen decarboxylase
LRAIGTVRRELDGRVPLIGFSGAPFTLASYAVEGGSSRDHAKVKGLMYEEPAVFDRLLGMLADRVGRYLKRQAEAGAQALQLFDSWAGALSPTDYERRVLPHSRRAIEIARSAGVPVIHFSTGTSGYLSLVAAAGADVLGVDWRVELDQARQAVGQAPVLQGNLDPVALTAPWAAVRAAADRVLASNGGRAGHVFNLGHGILPYTPPDNVARLVDYVHTATAHV